MSYLNQSGTTGLRDYFPNSSQLSVARSRTLPLIRTSWLINIMLFILQHIYSILSNLSIPPNPTVLWPVQPQLHSYSGQYGQCSSSMAGPYRSSTRPVCVTGQHQPRLDCFQTQMCNITNALSASPYHLPLQHIHIHTSSARTYHWLITYKHKHIVSQNISLIINK